MTTYKVVYNIGDKVYFKTSEPWNPRQKKSIYEVIYSAPTLEPEVIIKGVVASITDYYISVVSDNMVYICSRSMLKPLVREGEVLFFEKERLNFDTNTAEIQSHISPLSKCYIKEKPVIFFKGYIYIITALLLVIYFGYYFYGCSS